MDDRLFSGPTRSPGWAPTDVDDGYVAPVQALQINGGRLGEGHYARRSSDPALAAAQTFAEALRTPFYFSPASRLSPWGPAHDLRFSRFAYFDDPSYWRWQHERDLADFCMRSRGWRLMPVAKSPG